ncbi:MAG TPA: hypothetical protein VEH10_00050, partial [Thermoplasmata archaeon]|nr:hypothetical protein [Thermoplasmata archaeon]
MTITSTSVGPGGTSLTVFWSTTANYPPTIKFGYAPPNSGTTWISLGAGATSETVNSLTPSTTYTIYVDATETCPSGDGGPYSASATTQVTTTPPPAVIAGYVYLATPSGTSKTSPVYGAQVTIKGTSVSTVTGASGSYTLRISTSASSETVCTQAPGLLSATGSLRAVVSLTDCGSVSISSGVISPLNLLLRLNSTLYTPAQTVYANIDGCYDPFNSATCVSSSGVASSTGVAFYDISSLTTGMSSEQASQVTNPSGVGPSPDCPSGSSCTYVELSGTVASANTQANVYWEVLPLGYYGSGTGIPLSSPMQLTYYVYSTSACGHVALDAYFSDGSWLHSIQNNLGSYILDSNGKRIAPADQCVPSGVWTPEVVDLSEVTGKTISYLSVGFDNGGTVSGSFQAYFSGIELQGSEQPSSPTNGNFDAGLFGWDESGTVLPTAAHSGFVGAPDAVVGSTSPVGTNSPAAVSELSQEFRVPNIIGGGSICLNYYTYSNDPTPTSGYQRALLVDRTTGLSYYLAGSATSAATNYQQWITGCLNVTGGSSDLRGDRVWIELVVGQAADGYTTYALFDDVDFTPNDIIWQDAYTGSPPGNSYGFNGASISPLVSADLNFNEGLFPIGAEPTYLIP